MVALNRHMARESVKAVADLYRVEVGFAKAGVTLVEDGDPARAVVGCAAGQILAGALFAKNFRAIFKGECCPKDSHSG